MDQPQGWLSAAEANELQRLAAGLTVLEIGVWKGRSTVSLAAVAAHVISVDWFRGDGFTGPANTLPECWQNLIDHQVLDRVQLCVGDFRTVIPQLKLDNVGLVFYDADHTYAATRDAFEALLAAGLTARVPIAVHDYEPDSPLWDGVVCAVQDYCTAHSKRLRVVDRLAVIESLASPGR